ncbi:MAG: transglutaminase family protein [Thermomicrobiales bacterium]
MNVPDRPANAPQEQARIAAASVAAGDPRLAISLEIEAKPASARAFLVHQHFHYAYEGPVRDLRQRLMVIPPERHGDQRLVLHHLEVSTPTSGYFRDIDRFGNLRMLLLVDAVTDAITFTVWFVVERDSALGTTPVAAGIAGDPVWLQLTPLTAPDPAMIAAAAGMMAVRGDPLDQARRICHWIHERMRYEPGATTVQTTAAEAFASGRGVCQDFAHIMLAMCRTCGIPARYVSGHLMGEGGSHAWVEVILPDPEQPGRFVAYPFDPTHANGPMADTITVALGRDYADVPPTSGTFISAFGGHLTATKQATVMPSAAIPSLSEP